MADRLAPPVGSPPADSPDDPDGTGSLAHWHAQRRQLADVLGRLAEIARERGDQAAAERCSAGSERLTKGRLTLAVLGEFKRGKSTLINSLLGAEVMPVGVIPMTSVPLLVQYGDEPELTVELESGQRLPVDLTTLEDYATETGNPGNRKAVRRLLMTQPAPLLGSGVILVDTPGIGSIHAHNTESAYQLLTQADAAVFVLSVDSPASQAEMDFLAAARAEVSRLLVALNKVDLLSPEELQQSTQFVRTVLEQAAPGQEIELFPISARLRDPGYRVMAAALEKFLTEERGSFLLQRARDVAYSAIRNERLAVRLERAALALSATESERRRIALQQRLQEISHQRLEVEEVLRGDIGRLVAGTVAPGIERFRQRAMASVRAAVGEEIAMGRTGLRPRLEQRLAAVVADQVAAFVRELDGELAEGLGEIARRHTGRANALLAEVTRATAELFQVEVDEPFLPSALQPSSRRLVLTRVEDLALTRLSSALKGWLPGAVGSAVARRDALDRGDELVDRHCGRIHHDVLERLRRREQEWRDELVRALSSLEATIRRATAAAGTGPEEDPRPDERLAKLAARELLLGDLEAAAAEVPLG